VREKEIEDKNSMTDMRERVNERKRNEGRVVMIMRERRKEGCVMKAWRMKRGVEGKKKRDRSLKKVSIEVEVGRKKGVRSLEGKKEKGVILRIRESIEGEIEMNEVDLETGVTEERIDTVRVRDLVEKVGTVHMKRAMRKIERRGNLDVTGTTLVQSPLSPNVGGTGQGPRTVNTSGQNTNRLEAVTPVHRVNLAENTAVGEVGMSMNLEAVRSQVTNTGPDQGGQAFSLLIVRQILLRLSALQTGGVHLLHYFLVLYFAKIKSNKSS